MVFFNNFRAVIDKNGLTGKHKSSTSKHIFQQFQGNVRKTALSLRNTKRRMWKHNKDGNDKNEGLFHICLPQLRP
jgi:hypothetical protein